ncbi:MAG: AMP-binding protein [Bacteroidetes bacterium]|nr:AMP-binding protein [Bacteroidota bacterium]
MDRCTSNLPLENVYWREVNTPDKVYLTQPTGNGQVIDYSWSQVVKKARIMAAYLRSLEYSPQSHIAIVSKNCAHWIIADLAIWMAGHVSVPLYPTLTAESVRQILEHSESKLLFVGKLDTWDEMKNGVPDDMSMIAFPLAPEGHGLPGWEGVTRGFDPITDSPVLVGDTLATIVYTSGSTGTPKGVMLNFDAMGSGAESILKVLSTNEDDRMLSYLPLSHVFERWIVEVHSFLIGFHIFFAESLDTFIQDLQRAKPTLFLSVPRLWLKFQQGVSAKLPEEKLRKLIRIPLLGSFIKKKVLSQLGLQHVRFAGTGSAPIPAKLIDWYRDLGLELLEGYGMTENFACSHVSIPGKTRVGYVGNPYPGVEHRISEEGEIQVKSPGNTMGYYKAPELTKELFTTDGFIRTGDQGEIDSEGRLRITGRVKELFKTSKGKYVAPAPIENKILATNLAELACVGGSGFSQPYALIVLPEDIRDKLSRNLKEKSEIHERIEQGFKEVNKELDHHEQFQFAVVVKEPWSIENNLLTPTMKIRRAYIEKAYKSYEEGWYQKKEFIIWE